MLWGSAGDIALNLALSLVLMRLTPLGMAGAALGTVVATAAQSVFYLGAIRRGLGVGWGAVLPWKALGRAAARAALIFLPLSVLLVWGVPVADALGIAAVLGAVYGAVVWREVVGEKPRGA